MENVDLTDRAAVRLRDLSVGFNGRKAVDRVSLDFEAGALTVLLGRSGSGKTTLLRAVNRLNECFPQCRTSGRVEVRLGGAWHDAQSGILPLEELRRKVGMVFQSPNVLPMSVARNMTLPLKLTLGLSGEQARKRMEKALAEARLWDEVKDRLDHEAETLSGGQRQRLCLARALALEPEILLLDEPTASLDYKASEKVEDLLAGLGPRYTLIVVSHSLGQARRLGGRIHVMSEGRLTQSIDPSELDHADSLRRLVDQAF